MNIYIYIYKYKKYINIYSAPCIFLGRWSLLFVYIFVFIVRITGLINRPASRFVPRPRGRNRGNNHDGEGPDVANAERCSSCFGRDRWRLA